MRIQFVYVEPFQTLRVVPATAAGGVRRHRALHTHRSNSLLEARRSSSSFFRTAAPKASSCLSLPQSQSTKSCPPKKVPSSIFTLSKSRMRHEGNSSPAYETANSDEFEILRFI